MSIGIWDRFVGLITNPTQTIREMDEEPFGSVRNYYLGLLGIILLPVVLLLIGVVLFMGTFTGASGGTNSIIAAVVILAVIVVGIIIMITFMSACLHVAVLICGGNGAFTQTLKAYMNSLTPIPVLYVGALIAMLLVLVLPPLGFLVFYVLGVIVGAWNVALMIVGVQEYHHLTTFRSIAAYFIMQMIIVVVIFAVTLVLVAIVGATLGSYMSDPLIYQRFY